MTLVVRFIKLIAKVIAVIAIIIVVLSYQSYHRIRTFQVWRSSLNKEVTNIKYILIWSNRDHNFDVLLNDPFRKNKCYFTNCIVTKNGTLMKNYWNFDAILFSEKTISRDAPEKLPPKRFFNQTYVFVGRESADNYPVCDSKFNKFFNLTWSYKLNSDVVWPYFTVLNKRHKEVAPTVKVKWVKYNNKTLQKFQRAIVKVKKYPAVWFVSNCYTRSRRESFFNDLKIALKHYGLQVHVIGSCGTRICPIGQDRECMKSLKQYYFYLALENSISEDYVTEKVMKALLHYTVPVVYGGANYSRFLPPHSYIDGRLLGPKKTAAKMADLIVNQNEYLRYFIWKNHYIISNSSNSICKLCEALNKGAKAGLRKGVKAGHDDFRKWWHPGFKVICEKLKNDKKRDRHPHFSL